jgi:hypothetical protein
MIANCCHGSASRLMTPKPICFASSRESPSPSSQSAGNRMRRIEGKIGDLLPFAHDRSPDGAGQPAPGAAIAEDTRISLIDQSDALRARIGASAIRVTKLPFLTGRIPVAGEPKPSRLASHKPLQRSFAEYSWALLICIDLPARGLMTFSCLFECPSCIGWICSTVAFHMSGSIRRRCGTGIGVQRGARAWTTTAGPGS